MVFIRSKVRSKEHDDVQFFSSRRQYLIDIRLIMIQLIIIDMTGDKIAAVIIVTPAVGCRTE